MKAAEVAIKAKMPEALPEIYSKTSDPSVREFIDNYNAGGR